MHEVTGSSPVSPTIFSVRSVFIAVVLLACSASGAGELSARSEKHGTPVSQRITALCSSPATSENYNRLFLGFDRHMSTQDIGEYLKANDFQGLEEPIHYFSYHSLYGDCPFQVEGSWNLAMWPDGEQRQEDVETFLEAVRRLPYVTHAEPITELRGSIYSPGSIRIGLAEDGAEQQLFKEFPEARFVESLSLGLPGARFKFKDAVVYYDAREKRMKEVSNAIATDIGGEVVDVGSILPKYGNTFLKLKVCSDAMTADKILQAFRQHSYPEMIEIWVDEERTTVVVPVRGDVGCWIRELRKEPEIITVIKDRAVPPY